MAAVDSKIKEYQDLQNEFQSLYARKSKSLAQFNENTLVKSEIDLLSEDTPIYKLVGPVLMTVSLDDAKENVSKRLEFIEDEIKRLDTSLEAKQQQQDTLGAEITKLQQQMQAEAVAAARGVSKGEK